jgi:murein DD-endopeptidase MepM/ murein hydrolase activator NlpD
LYRIDDVDAGGAATLRLERPAFAPSFGAPATAPATAAPSLNLLVDLGSNIGSRTWFRGLFTCGALCYVAWSLAPGVEPIAGPNPLPYPDAQAEEARSLAIAPLAYGGSTGRRMAPTDAVEPLADIPERPTLDLRATLGPGDGIAAALVRAGVGQAEADAAASMIGAVVPVAEIRPGTVMDVTLGRRPDRSVARPLDRLAFRARFDLRLEIARRGSQLQLVQTPISVDATPLRIQGRAGQSLYRSARAAGVPARIVETYLRALTSQIPVPEGIGADDRFDIIVEHRRAATGETETGQLLYAGLVRAGGRALQMMPWTVGGQTQWFEASGVGRQMGGVQQPVRGRLTSGFGLRMHPIHAYARYHRGLDIGAPSGTPIVAAIDGTVVRAGWAGGYGNQVRLSHNGGLGTSYSHMSRIAVAPGTRVRQGQVIGYVGSTGLSTGPHLHYEMYRNGGVIDPRSMRFASRSLLEGQDLVAFRSRLQSLLATPLGGAGTAERTAP